ncbi:MAG: hypothetical protein AAFQ02_03135 [Bacteroidota bacterium]
MAGKYKMTGCARFFFFLIILIPIAYFGSKYLMESGTWDEVRETVGIEKSDDRSESNPLSYENDTDTRRLERKLQQLIETIREQQTTIDQQQKTLNDQQDLIVQLKRRLGESTASPTQTQASPESNQPRETPDSGESLEELLKEADRAMRNNRN